jgi:hypothetical protein
MTKTVQLTAHAVLRPRRSLVRPTLQTYRFRNRELERMARSADAVGARMSPYVQYTEQAQLSTMFGNFVARVNGAISAPAAATTSLTVMGTAGSGNADVTPASGMVWVFATPGSGATINAYSNPDVLTATGGSATTFTIASQTVGKSRAVGDCAFSMGTTAAPLAAWQVNTIYIGLSTAAATASQAAILAAEPVIGTGAYARIPVLNNPANFPAASAASPSVLTCGGPFSFPASTAAWSTGATSLATMFMCTNATGTAIGTNNFQLLLAGALGTGQAVNTTGITLSFAASAITITAT